MEFSSDFIVGFPGETDEEFEYLLDFIKEAKVTTSKNIDDPEYYIRVRSGKFIPKNKIIAGPSNLYIYDVPTPIFLPFAYFPLTEDRNSGGTHGDEKGHEIRAYVRLAAWSARDRQE